MKARTKCFWLRTALTASLCGAALYLGAYAAGEICAQMLLTPLWLLLSYGLYKTEQGVRAKERARRAAARRLYLCTRPGQTEQGENSQYFAAKSSKAS